jgi:hypothetical protein
MKSAPVKVVTLAMMLLGLPLVDASLAGHSLDRYFQFPTTMVTVPHAGFSWSVFALIAGLALCVVVPRGLQAFRGRKLGLLPLLAALLLAVPEAEACECPRKSRSEKADLEAADTVFSGRVISSTPSADDTELVHRFEVSGLYKGNIQRVTHVVTKGGKGCGFPFKPGESYLVFSTGHETRSTTLCGGTRVLAQAGPKRPTLKSAPCALALEPALDKATKAAASMFQGKKDFSQYPSSHVTVFCQENGRADVVFRRRTIPAEQLSMVRDAIEAHIVLNGKSGKVERLLVGP